MTTSHLKTVLPGPVQTVWAIVRDVQRYPDWRSDVERVETPDARTFREYTKGGYVTNFTIIGEEPCRRWVGAFRQRGAATVVDFTEYVAAKKFWMRPFVKWYLKRQQAQFAADLRAALQAQRLL